MYLDLNFKGQISSYSTPISVMIIVSLLAFTFYNFATTQADLRQTSNQIETQVDSIQIFKDTQECLSTNGVILNQSKLEEYSRKDYKIPECAQHSELGLNYNIKQNFLSSMLTETSQKPIQVAIVFDTSGSMSLNDVDQDYSGRPINVDYGFWSKDSSDSCPEFGCDQNNYTRVVHAAGALASNTADSLKEDDQVALITYGSDAEIQYDFSSDKEDFENEISDVELSTTTRIDSALEIAKNLDWEKGSENITILLTDGRQSPSSQEPGVEEPQKYVEDLQQIGVEIHGVLFGRQVSGNDNFSPDPGNMTEYLQINDGTGCALDSSINGEGRCWYANSYQTLTQVYQSIQREVRSPTAAIGGNHTCSLPPEQSIEGDLEVVFVHMTSENHGNEWNNYCSVGRNLERKLEDEDVKVSMTYYSAGNDFRNRNGRWVERNADEGSAEPMTIDGKQYSYEGKENLPYCVESGNIAKIRSDINVTSDTDSGLNSWGSQLNYVLENHDWDINAENRVLVTVGDSVPSGGKGPDAFRTSEPSESDIVDRVIARSQANNVDIIAAPLTSKMVYDNKKNYGESSINDAKELLKKAAEATGGKYIQEYDSYNSTTLYEIVEDKYSSFSYKGATCSNVNYRFGDDLQPPTETFSYNVPIKQDSGLSNPGRMEIKISEKPVHKLVGNIRAMREGQTRRINLNLQRGLESRENSFEKQKLSTYTLSPDNLDLGDGSMRLGINGEEKLEFTGSADLTASSFEAYKDSSIQLIVQSEKVGNLPSISVTSNAETQILKQSNIPSSSNTFYNFTQLDIGSSQEIFSDSVCVSGTNNCYKVDKNLEEFRLPSGTSSVVLNYDGGSVSVN
jgi:hypothetical protein